jgi:hypothetical protein
MVFTFYLWVKAVRTGSMLWAAASAVAYFYMVMDCSAPHTFARGSSHLLSVCFILQVAAWYAARSYTVACLELRLVCALRFCCCVCVGVVTFSLSI